MKKYVAWLVSVRFFDNSVRGMTIWEPPSISHCDDCVCYLSSEIDFINESTNTVVASLLRTTINSILQAKR